MKMMYIWYFLKYQIMKILTIGDPHFQMNNLDEVKSFVKKCLQFAEKADIEGIVVLGDVLHDHERVHSTALNVAVDFLNKLSEIAHTWVLVGNHDLINNSQFLTSNHWMNALKLNPNITVVDDVVSETIDGKSVLMAPFVPPGRFVEALETKLSTDEWQSSDLVFAHQEFKGVKMGSIVSDIGDDWDETWPFVVTGHIHKNQTPQSNVYYPGSAIQVAFGESEMNIVALVDTETINRESIEEIDLGLQRKKIVYSDPSNLRKIAKTIDPGGAHENHKLKVCIDGTKEEFKALKKTAAYKKLQKKGVKIVHKRKRATINAENMATVNAIAASGTQSNNFSDILNSIVDKSDSAELRVAYSNIKNNI